MRKIIIIALVAIVAVIIAISFGVKGVVLEKGKNIARESDLRNKDNFLKLAKSYEEGHEYVKARNILSEFIERFPESSKNEALRRDIESLNMKILFSDIPTEESFLYEIQAGDTLAKIATRYGTTVELLKRANGLNSDLILPGKSLKVSSVKFSIFVDKSENKLILRKADGKIFKTYRVSTGANLCTPTGTFKIEEKLISPMWYKVGAIVEPGSPEYELGTRWLGLSEAGYGIHGTKDESLIGQHITKGCVRMMNSDVEELYAIVPSGTEVVIVE